MIDKDTLAELGFVETTHCENFWSKKKKAYKYETTLGEDHYSLTVFESKNKIVVLTEIDKYQLEIKYNKPDDAIEHITGRVEKWKE